MFIGSRSVLIAAVVVIAALLPCAAVAQVDEFVCSVGPGVDGLIRIDQHIELTKLAPPIDPKGGVFEAVTRPGGLTASIVYKRNNGYDADAWVSVLNADDLRAYDWVTVPSGRRFVTGTLALIRYRREPLHVEAGSELYWRVPLDLGHNTLEVYLFDSWNRKSAGPFPVERIDPGELRLVLPAGNPPGCGAAIVVTR